MRAISGAREIGYYVGRLIAAKGEAAGQVIDVTNRNDLAFIGSTRSWAEPAIPTLVVRFAEKGDRCGIVFDASQWDTDRAVDGYVAYEMTCDQRLAAELPLKAVSYPARYVLP